MTTATDALARGIESAMRLTLMMTEDLKGSDWLHRPCAGANCAAWTVGHLVITSRMMMSKAGGGDLPALPDGFEKRFARDESAPKAADFGDVSNLRELFQQHHERFAAFVKSFPVDKLDTVIADHRAFRTIGELFAFAAVHISMHAGQISTIRRSLGRPPLV